MGETKLIRLKKEANAELARARKRLGVQRAKRDKLVQAVEEARKRLDREHEGTPEHKDAEHDLNRRRSALERKRKSVATNDRRRRHWQKALRARLARLKRWRREHAGFEPWMANGDPHEALSDAAKRQVFVAVTEHGLYVTSTYEGQPGDGVHSTTSGHYIQNTGRPARTTDIAGKWDSMIAFQRWVAREYPACREVFGPSNNDCLKNGQRITLGEGTPIEQMHDSHVHTYN